MCLLSFRSGMGGQRCDTSHPTGVTGTREAGATSLAGQQILEPEQLDDTPYRARALLTRNVTQGMRRVGIATWP